MNFTRRGRFGAGCIAIGLVELGPHLERGLFCARHEHDVGTHHVGDRAREQRVVRATEHERVDARLLHRREQPFGEHVHLIGVDVALFDELDESRDTPRT